MTWQFLNTGFRDGVFNMRFDEELASALKAGGGQPTIRVFGWKPYCISLGFNQKIEDVNLEQCRREGIDVVRRPTGGRAILHAEELTYSVVMFVDGRNILETYRDISHALVRGLRLLGADVELAKSQPDFQKLYRNPSSVPCFSSSARYEIEYQGRKLVGSAQRRFDNVVLQHGSVLIGDFHQRLADFLTLEMGHHPVGSREHSKREELRQTLADRTVTLSEILQRTVTFEEVAECVKRGFEAEWQIQWSERVEPVLLVACQ